MIRKISMVGICLLGSANAHAVVNVQGMLLQEKEMGLTGSVEVSGAGKRGNSVKNDLNLGLALQYLTPTSRDLLLSSYEYSDVREVKDDEKLFAHLRHTQDFTSSWAWEAFAQFEHKPFNRIDQRWLLGSGLRFRFNEEKKFKGKLGVGLMYEQEKLTFLLNDPQEQQVENIRLNSFGVLTYQLSENAKIGASGYYQPKADDSSNYRAIGNLGIHTKVTTNFSLSANLNLSYDSMPPQGVLKEDLSYKFGLNYKF